MKDDQFYLSSLVDYSLFCYLDSNYFQITLGFMLIALSGAARRRMNVDSFTG